MRPSEVKVLALVREHQPVARRDIAKMLGVKPTTASVHLQSLKRQGLATGSSRGRDSMWSLTCVARAGVAAGVMMVNDVWSFAARQGASQ